MDCKAGSGMGADWRHYEDCEVAVWSLCDPGGGFVQCGDGIGGRWHG